MLCLFLTACSISSMVIGSSSASFAAGGIVRRPQSLMRPTHSSCIVIWSYLERMFSVKMRSTSVDDICWAQYYRIFCVLCAALDDSPLSEGGVGTVFLPTPCLAPRCLLTFRHRASSILGQAFHYSPENALSIFNQQI